MTETGLDRVFVEDGIIWGESDGFVVYPGPVATIEIEPEDSYIIFFNCQDYDAYFYDEYGNDTMALTAPGAMLIARSKARIMPVIIFLKVIPPLQ